MGKQNSHKHLSQVCSYRIPAAQNRASITSTLAGCHRSGCLEGWMRVLGTGGLYLIYVSSGFHFSPAEELQVSYVGGEPLWVCRFVRAPVKMSTEEEWNQRAAEAASPARSSQELQGLVEGSFGDAHPSPQGTKSTRGLGDLPSAPGC